MSELAELPLWIIHIAWPIAGVHLDRCSLGEQMLDRRGGSLVRGAHDERHSLTTVSTRAPQRWCCSGCSSV